MAWHDRSGRLPWTRFCTYTFCKFFPKDFCNFFTEDHECQKYLWLNDSFTTDFNMRRALSKIKTKVSKHHQYRTWKTTLWNQMVNHVLETVQPVNRVAVLSLSICGTVVKYMKMQVIHPYPKIARKWQKDVVWTAERLGKKGLWIPWHRKTYYLHNRFARIK